VTPGGEAAKPRSTRYWRNLNAASGPEGVKKIAEGACMRRAAPQRFE
jgi:hypothetical protein